MSIAVGHRFAILATMLIAFAVCLGSDSPANARDDNLFARPTLLHLRLSIDGAQMERLRQNGRADVNVSVTEEARIWQDVEVHVKGRAGSYRGVDDRPSLTLSFNGLVPGQRFHGLRKIHLNNSVQDSSYLCEYVSSELFRTAGVPAARVAFATVELNGSKRGLYVLKEGFTKDLLRQYFPHPTGNLYDGGFRRDINEKLERHLGSEDVDDWSDLRSLAIVAQEPDEKRRWKRLNQLLDVERFMSYAALEVMTCDWDGYVKSANNYRVYHDVDSGKMVFMPTGMDQLFWRDSGGVMPTNWFHSLVGEGLIATTRLGEAMFLKRFGEIYTNVFRIETMTNRVDELATLLRPFAGTNFERHFTRVRQAIIARHEYLREQLSKPAPPNSR